MNIRDLIDALPEPTRSDEELEAIAAYLSTLR